MSDLLPSVTSSPLPIFHDCVEMSFNVCSTVLVRKCTGKHRNTSVNEEPVDWIYSLWFGTAEKEI